LASLTRSLPGTRCHSHSSMEGLNEAVPDKSPHRDATDWGQLVESLDVASIFVVIGSWQSAKLRAEITAEDIWQETLWCSWRGREQHEWRSGPATNAPNL
jgi:hypothetical protein